MSRFLVNLLSPQRQTHVVDVGANPIDGDPPYKTLLSQGLCAVTGFEPQAQALAELNLRKGSNETYLPYAIGHGGPAELNVCRYSGWTSLLKPRVAALEVFPQFQSNATVESVVQLHTKRLDDVAELSPFDMLKIDVQGAEFDVFESGRERLKQAVVIQTEISFIALYEQQPTFGTIDQVLRSMGFVPHCFAQIKHWPIAPLTASHITSAGPQLNQLLEADMVYVKDFVQPVTMDNEQLKHLCLLMHHCYRSFDLSARCIDLLQQRGAMPSDALQRYVDHLNAGS
jgi:FkbM family methyltransferase